MFIVRKINGETIMINLEESEIYQAYLEQERAFDTLTCKDGLIQKYTDEPWLDDALENKDLIDELVYVYRKNIDKYEMMPEYALDDAFTDSDVVEIIEAYMEEEENE